MGRKENQHTDSPVQVEHDFKSCEPSQMCKNADRCKYYASPAQNKVGSYPNPVTYVTSGTLSNPNVDVSKRKYVLVLPNVSSLLLIVSVRSQFRGRASFKFHRLESTVAIRTRNLFFIEDNPLDFALSVYILTISGSRKRRSVYKSSRIIVFLI